MDRRMDRQMDKWMDVWIDRQEKWHIEVGAPPKKGEVKTKKRSHAKSNLDYKNYFTFYKYSNIKEFAKSSFDSKLNDLKGFQDKLESF